MSHEPPFAPETFLLLAKKLVERSGDDAALRTVISRAYYSAFLTIRRRRRTESLSHLKVWTEVEQNHSILGGVGHRLRRLRNAADYGDEIPELKAAALNSIEDAEILIAHIQ